MGRYAVKRALIIFLFAGTVQAQWVDTTANRLWRAGVIYVDWPDLNFITTVNRPYGYLVTDYDSALNSTTGAWYDTTLPTAHPENIRIRGSSREYWREITGGKMDISFTMVNAKDSTAQYQRPTWFRYSQNRDNYLLGGFPNSEYTREALQGMFTLGRLQSLTDYDVYIIVCPGGGFTNATAGCVTTQWGLTRTVTGPGDQDSYTKFNLGRIDHELGHAILGLTDYRAGFPYGQLGGFDLMGFGNFNTDATSAADTAYARWTAIMNPHHRAHFGWISPVDILTGQLGFQVEQGRYYRIKTANGNWIYLEKRRNSTSTRDVLPFRPNNNNVLIWWASGTSDVVERPCGDPPSYSDSMAVKHAFQAISGSAHNFYNGADTNIYFPRSGLASQDYHFTSLPPTLTDAGDLNTGISFKGIRRTSDLIATIDSLKLYPSATTLAPTNVGSSSAKLNATVFWNLETTTITFYWGANEDNNQFNDPVVWDSAVVANWRQNGNKDTTVTGLISSQWYTTYVKAASALGSSTGGRRVFRTGAFVPGDPVAVTLQATDVTHNSATLKGSVNPNGLSTVTRFRWGTWPSFSDTASVAGSPFLDSVVINVSHGIGGLAANTLYMFQLFATNDSGASFGSILTFTTDPQPPQPPSIVTLAPTGVATTSATLRGTASANGISTTATFLFRRTSSPAYTDTFSAAQNPITGDGVAVSYAIGGTLSPGTSYSYRARAQSTGGTALGLEVQFTTLPGKPAIISQSAIGVGHDRATFTSTFTDSGGTITAYRYVRGTVLGTFTDTTTVTDPYATTTATQAGLQPQTKYYWRAEAVNAIGTGFRGTDSLTTTAVPPPATITGNTIITKD